MKQSSTDVEGCGSQKVLFQPNMRVFLQYSVKFEIKNHAQKKLADCAQLQGSLRTTLTLHKRLNLSKNINQHSSELIMGKWLTGPLPLGIL